MTDSEKVRFHSVRSMVVRLGEGDIVFDASDHGAIALVNGTEGFVAIGYAQHDNADGNRIVDALAATKAAVEEGIVAGGGTAFAKAVAALLLTTEAAVVDLPEEKSEAHGGGMPGMGGMGGMM